jgi:hypothetical protein
LNRDRRANRLFLEEGKDAGPRCPPPKSKESSVTAKNLLAAVLVLFVLTSIVVLVAKEMKRSSALSGSAAGTSLPAGTTVIVYYFHGKVRCPMCASIESCAKEALESDFAEQLHSGRLVWRVVNYEEPGNEHFAKDYNLAAPALVLASVRDGKQAQWLALPEVWDHVGDKPAMLEFIKKNVREFLDGAAEKANRG